LDLISENLAVRSRGLGNGMKRVAQCLSKLPHFIGFTAAKTVQRFDPDWVRLSVAGIEAV
jgi:hypothetical protein